MLTSERLQNVCVVGITMTKLQREICKFPSLCSFFSSAAVHLTICASAYQIDRFCRRTRKLLAISTARTISASSRQRPRQPICSSLDIVFAARLPLTAFQYCSNNILMQLRKLLAHPYLIAPELETRDLPAAEQEKNMIAASAKLVVLALMLPKLKARGHRVLIVSRSFHVSALVQFLLYALIAVHSVLAIQASSRYSRGFHDLAFIPLSSTRWGYKPTRSSSRYRQI